MWHANVVFDWLESTHPDLSFSADDIRQWRDSLKARYAISSCNHYLTKLRFILDSAVTLGMLQHNPARKIKRLKVRQAKIRYVLSEEESNQLLFSSLENRSRITGCLPTFVHLGLYTGMRPEEARWAQWAWIDWKRGIIVIQETISPSGEKWMPKNAQARTLDVKQELLSYLADEKKRLKDIGSPFIIPGGNQQNKKHFALRPIGERTLSRAFERLVLQEGMDKRITLYSLRHTYGTMLLRYGVDLRTVQVRMGHESIRTTMGYLHAVEAEKHPTDALPY